MHETEQPSRDDHLVTSIQRLARLASDLETLFLGLEQNVQCHDH